MLNRIIKELEKSADLKQAQKMSAYMKNNFTFAGIPKPKLKEIIKPFINETAKEKLNWDLVFGLWNVDFREAQYIALEYLSKHQKELKPTDIEKFKKLITTKSWWETVDTIDAFVGKIVLMDNNLKQVMLEWATSDNIWLKRTAIDFQQEYKENTDKELLSKIILQNLGSEEFFINKAIGWSLRDYSKVNPDWVQEFVENNKDKMATLSIKEATKMLK